MSINLPTLYSENYKLVGQSGTHGRFGKEDPEVFLMLYKEKNGIPTVCYIKMLSQENKTAAIKTYIPKIYNLNSI